MQIRKRGGQTIKLLLPPLLESGICALFAIQLLQHLDNAPERLIPNFVEMLLVQARLVVVPELLQDLRIIVSRQCRLRRRLAPLENLLNNLLVLLTQGVKVAEGRLVTGEGVRFEPTAIWLSQMNTN